MKSSPFVPPRPVAPVRCVVLLLGLLSGCATPVTHYTPAQLLPVPAVLPADSVLRLAGTRLCQGLGTEWDSALVMVAYKAPAAIRAFRVENYMAVHGPVCDQEYNEGTATLLFVKSGHYTAYCVFPPTVYWVGFVNAKAPRSQLAWLTPRDCERLSARAKRVPPEGTITYVIRLSPR